MQSLKPNPISHPNNPPEPNLITKGRTCDIVLKSIRSLIRVVNTQAKELEQGYGVTGAQLVILQEIHKTPFVTTGKIAENLDISQSTATLILDKLENKGMVVRNRDLHDKRKWLLSLTKAGEKLLKKAPIPLHNEFISRFEQLPHWQQTQILSVLQQVVALFNSYHMVQESAAIIEANIKIE